MSNSSYGAKPATTFRTANGFRRWAFDHDMEAATGDDRGATFQMFVENASGELLVVTFAKGFGGSGQVIDAMLHREHVSHMLGSNTLSTLLRITIKGNKETGQ